MKKLTTTILSMTLIVATIATTGCDQLKRFIGSGERAMVYCDIGTATALTLKDEKLLSPEQAEKIIRAIARVRQGAAIFVEHAKSYIGRRIDDGIKADLAALLPEILAGLDQLEQTGLINLKPEVKQRFDSVMIILKSAARLIKSRLTA